MSPLFNLLMEPMTYLLTTIKKCIHKCYAPILPQKNNEDISSGSEYGSAKRRLRRNKNIILDLLLNKSKSFE